MLISGGVTFLKTKVELALCPGAACEERKSLKEESLVN